MRSGGGKKMFHSRELFPDSDHALLANRVVLVLNKIRNDQHAPERDEALKDAVAFLRFVLRGKDLTNRREINQNSYQAALAYGEAIEAVKRLPERRGTIDGDSESILRDLFTFASALQKERNLEKPQLQELLHFFRLVRDLTVPARARKTEVLKFFE
jgi:hypothetical protein